jgi:hypothetical protein
MVSEDKGYVIGGSHRCCSAMARWFPARGSNPVVQRPVCCDVAFSDECLRLYDSGTEFARREGLRQGSADLRQRRDDHLGLDAGEPGWAATARLWERDLAGRAPASHAGLDLEAVMAMKPVEQSLWCSGLTTEVGQRGAVA